MKAEHSSGAAIGVLALCALAGSCNRSTGPRLPAGTATVVRMDMPTEVVANGPIRPEVGAEVNVGPRISGVLRRLFVRVGDSVTKGQLLAELDHSDLDAAVDEASADVREAEAQAVRSNDEKKRREALAGSGLLSAEDLDLARSDALVASARLGSALARLERAKITRGYAEVAAPISGTVTSIATREGETVASSFAVPTFVTIMDLSRLQVEANVDEVDIGRVAVGQAARFTVDAFPQETFGGTIVAVIPQAKVRESVVTYEVIVRIATPNRTMLRPGMTASVTITCGERRGALVLPTRAIRRDADGRPYVMVREGGKAVRRDVAVGELRGGNVRLTAGLAEGQEVLLPPTVGDSEAPER